MTTEAVAQKTPRPAAKRARISELAAQIDVWKQPVRAATTANMGTLTGEQTIDGVALRIGDRYLRKNQTAGAANGIFVVRSGAHTRALDADHVDKLANGTMVLVQEGSTNIGTVWRHSTAGTIVLETTSLTFTAFGTGSSGGFSLARTAVKTSNYSAAVNDLIPCDTTSAGFTVTLPTAPADKSLIAVKLVTLGGTNAVTIACGGSDVFNKTSGATTRALSILNESVLLEYTASGAIWTTVAGDTPLASLDSRIAATYPTFDEAIFESQVFS